MCRHCRLSGQQTNCQCIVSPPIFVLVLLMRSGDVSRNQALLVRRGSTPLDIIVLTAAKVSRFAVEQFRVTPASLGFTPTALVCYQTVLMTSYTAVETTSLSCVINVLFTPCLSLTAQPMTTPDIDLEYFIHLYM